MEEGTNRYANEYGTGDRLTMNIHELAIKAGLKKEHGSDREYINDFDYNEFARLLKTHYVNELRQEWYNLNDTSTDSMDSRAIAIHVGMKSGLIKAIARLNK